MEQHDRQQLRDLSLHPSHTFYLTYHKYNHNINIYVLIGWLVVWLVGRRWRAQQRREAQEKKKGLVTLFSKMIIMEVEEEEKKSEYEKIKKEREYTFMEDEAKMTSNQFFFSLLFVW